MARSLYKPCTALLALALAFACATPSTRVETSKPTAPSQPEDAGVVLPALAAFDAGAGSVDAAVATPAARCGNLRWVSDFCYVRDLGDPMVMGGIETEPWLLAHSVPKAKARSLMEAWCRPLSVGPDKEDALLCVSFTRVVGGENVYRAVQRVSVRAVRRGVIAVLLDVPVAFSNFDSVGQDDGETAIFGLVIDARDAARKIVLSEPRPGECAKAAKAAADGITERLAQKPVVPIEIAIMRFDAKLLESTICSMARTYEWSKGSYRATR